MTFQEASLTLFIVIKEFPTMQGFFKNCQIVWQRVFAFAWIRRIECIEVDAIHRIEHQVELEAKLLEMLSLKRISDPNNRSKGAGRSRRRCLLVPTRGRVAKFLCCFHLRPFCRFRRL